MQQRSRCRDAIYGTVGSIAVLAAIGAPAHAFTAPTGWQVQERFGTSLVTVEPGVTHIRVIALGGRGGGVAGGLGARVEAEIPVTVGQIVALRVGSNGGVARRTLPDGTAPAGLGGGASAVSLCAPAPASCNTAALGFSGTVVAAGGGGSGGANALFPGGAGGAAGAPGASGRQGPLAGAAGGGGGAATVETGGAGGTGGLVPSGCSGIVGNVGSVGLTLFGGRGGFASDPSREGGVGGDGVKGGGGGGAAASCNGVQAGGSGGGGGGASRAPAGGTIAVNPNPADGPLIAYLLVREAVPPTITVSAPVKGARYLVRTVVAARYSCADEAGGSGIASCVGTVSSGQAIDTATPGRKTFTVTATDRAGNVKRATVKYTVAPAPTPIVRGVAVTARAFRFMLSAPARVTLRVEQRKQGKRARWTHVGTLRHGGRRGANAIAFNGRVGRRKLAAGSYRIVIHATARGKRSKPAIGAFAVKTTT